MYSAQAACWCARAGLSMDEIAVDVWFGPGAEKGVFGAGVAAGLQEAIASGDLNGSQIRLYGSSIGCLTAAFLATGNANCGLQIFQEETQQLVSMRNLLPAIACRTFNRIGRAARRGESLVRVPAVLDLEHVFAVMARRTPQIAQQLACSPIPVFAETVDLLGRIRHVELSSADDPIEQIRCAVNYFPFTGPADLDQMDSVIKGYGFVDLLDASDRPLVIVLNAKPTAGSAIPLSDYLCAALSGDWRVAKLYLGRRSNRHSACQMAHQAAGRVLLISPPRIVKLTDTAGFKAAHGLGKESAKRIIDFLNSASAAQEPSAAQGTIPRKSCDSDRSH